MNPLVLLLALLFSINERELESYGPFEESEDDDDAETDYDSE